MFLAKRSWQSTLRIGVGLAWGLAACSLQVPSEDEIFGAAGGKSEARAGAAGGGTLASSGDGGADPLGEGGDSANPAPGGSSGSGSAEASSGSGASSGSKGSAGSSAAAGSSGASGSNGTAGSNGSAGSTGFDPATGLVSLFAFDEPNGAVAANAKDSTKNAKCVGTCTRPTGQLGQAFGLRNDVSPSDWIELPMGLLASRSAITLSAWLRDRSSSRSGAPLFHFGVGSKESFFFVPDDQNARSSSTGAHLGGVHGSESFVDLWSTRVDFTDKVWHHVAVSWNADSIELYLDGKSAGSAARPGVLPSQLGTTSPNYLGRLPDETSLALYGEIDDLRVYDRVLSATQVAALYKLR